MGNPMLRLFVVIAVLLGGGYFAMRAWREKSTDFDHRSDLDRIRKEYFERAAWVRAVPVAASYRDEMRGLLRWYFQELTDHYNKFPAYKNYARAMDELNQKLRQRRIREDEHKLKQEFYEYARAGFDAMREGRYDPMLTAGDKSLRLDVLDVRREGVKLRMELALWGAQRRWNEQSEAGVKVRKMQVNAQFQELGFRFLDVKGKITHEMNASGEPELKVEHPERWIDEFPPQVVLGYYTLDPFPAGVDKVEMTVAVLSRSPTGEEILGRFQWEFPVKEAMRLRPGETWEGATVETRPEEYIGRKTR